MNDPLLNEAAKLWYDGELFIRYEGYWLRNPERFSLRMTNMIQGYFGHGNAGRVAFNRWVVDEVYPVKRRLTVCEEPGWIHMVAGRGVGE